MVKSMRLILVLSVMLFSSVFADMYLQTPRGCNDRLNEPNADRQNANRLFDSENNARGGYCWGPAMKYYEGSILPIEWTAQHGCGGPHVSCNEIIQYMCDPSIRDGTETTTIPDDANTYNDQTNGVYKYGMNEGYSYYQDCKTRERNKGIFTADQNVGKNAINTRQNPGGTRYGFECTEERDYYPYWHPSPWKDIVVMTGRTEDCPFYQAESQNVKAKNYCKITTTGTVPNQESTCLTAGGTWETQAAFGIPAPECKFSAFSRDNHLGNTIDGQTANYTWILPNAKVEPCITAGTCNCVLRIRYNITTNESTGLRDKFLDSRNNSANSPLKNNPTVNVEGGEVTLALNTAQVGRTFQDRSFMFHILPRPSGVSDSKKIYNLNVRGKRGNIVQTFPATEYDFTPGRLEVDEGDIIHFQWTGCDTNPANNQGEGKVQGDRSNIVQIKDLDNNIPVIATNDTVEKLLFDSEYLRTRMALIDQKNCVPVATLLAQNGNNANTVNQLDTNCAKLNAAATPYFDGGLVRMNQTGKFTYMSTRNNNFSNRTQKGQITVNAAEEKKMSGGAVAAIVVVSIAVIAASLGGLVFYGKKNPHTAIGRAVDKVPTPSFGRGSSSSAGPTTARRLPLLNNDHGGN